MPGSTLGPTEISILLLTNAATEPHHAVRLQEFTEELNAAGAHAPVTAAETASAYTHLTGQQVSVRVKREVSGTVGHGQVGEAETGLFVALGTSAYTAAPGNHGHENATGSVPGFMSAADKTKLDAAVAVTKQDTASVALSLIGQEMSAAVRRKVPTAVTEGRILETEDGLVTQLGSSAYTAAPGNHGHANATAGTHGFMSAEDKAKLDGLEGSIAVADTNSLALHFDDEILSGTVRLKAPVSLTEGEIQEDEEGISVLLGNSAYTAAPGDHAHTPAQVGLGNVNNTSDEDKPVSGAQQAALDDKADLVGGKVPAGQLPSYVDDVLEAANLAAFPGTGETGKIYAALDTGKIYRWSGSAYVEISDTPALADQGEAEGGTDNAKLMTPLRTAQAIAALAGGGSAAIRASGVLVGGTAEVAGVAEITQVTCLADTNGNRHNKRFRIFRASGERCIVLDCGGSSLEATVDFTGLTGADFVTLGAGKAFGFDVVGASALAWFNTGTEDVSGTLEIPISTLATDEDIAAAAASVLNDFFTGTQTATAAGAVLTIAANSNYYGEVYEVTTGAVFTYVSPGRNDASPEGGVTTIFADYVENDTAAAIAAAIATAANGLGWAVGASGDDATFTDSALGPRTDASDTDTGFTVAVTQQGVDDVPETQVTEVELVPAVAGKTTKPGGLGLITADGLDATWTISLKTPGPVYADIITGAAVAAGANMLLAPSPSEFAAYFAGVADASLVARITGTVPADGSLTLWTEATTQI